MSWKNDQVSPDETETILKLAGSRLNTAGDFVEFGCYRGDTSLLLAELLKNHHSSQKLWIYDSFAGLPEKGSADFSSLGQDFQAGELFVTKREVKERFLRANLPVPIIKKAWFNDLTPDDLPTKISFAFLDGDLYSSIQISLSLIENRLIKDSLVLVHDYNNPALPGVAKAVDEWLSIRPAVKNHTHSSLIILEIQ